LNRRCITLLLALLLPLPPAAVAESGPAWLPETTPPRGFHLTVAGWQVMIHGNGFGQFIRESGERGNWQLGSVNWLMARADRGLAGGTLGVRAMVSAEWLTLTRAGYPALLQVGQPYRSGIVTDRMHPHELLGEAAITYEHDVVHGLGTSLYLAAAGEPALGPVAYLHRPSAMNDPIAPLGHHAQDETHERFGVATLGLFTRHARFEISAFNGNHPDDVRTNLEISQARLNSLASRITVNPSPEWSLSASGAFIAASSLADHSHGALHRYVVAISRVRPHREGVWASTLVWAANSPIGTRRVFHSALLETTFELNDRNTVFGRVEYAARTAEELNLVGSVTEQLGVGAAAVGYARGLTKWRAIDVWLGGRATAYLLPDQLRVFYGAQVLSGFAVYVQLRPPLMHEPMQ
jgi:hypothetical protein